MGKIALLKFVSFEKKNSFEELTSDKIRDYLKDKIEFINIKKPIDIFENSKNIFGSNVNNMEITLCNYDAKYAIHSISIDDDNEKIHNNVIFTKRFIFDNDDYSVIDPNNIDDDKYIYCDISIDDIIDIMKKKSIIKCCDVSYNGDISEKEMIFLNSNDDVGKILIKNKCNNEINDLIYLNMSNLINKYHSQNENKIEDIIKEKTNAYYAKYIYNQIDLGFIILNYFCETYSENKNEKISKLINHDIYGNVLIYFQIKSEDDSESYIDINTDLLEKINNLVSSNKKMERENNFFFNIYRQFQNCENIGENIK
jgi:hypothetical protein